ncbi:hypothetical protein ACLKA7_016486 [Drosophila subpalustris]
MSRGCVCELGLRWSLQNGENVVAKTTWSNDSAEYYPQYEVGDGGGEGGGGGGSPTKSFTLVKCCCC